MSGCPGPPIPGGPGGRSPLGPYPGGLSPPGVGTPPGIAPPGGRVGGLSCCGIGLTAGGTGGGAGGAFMSPLGAGLCGLGCIGPGKPEDFAKVPPGPTDFPIWGTCAFGAGIMGRGGRLPFANWPDMLPGACRARRLAWPMCSIGCEIKLSELSW